LSEISINKSIKVGMLTVVTLVEPELHSGWF
jgi:hypothetical protein